MIILFLPEHTGQTLHSGMWKTHLYHLSAKVKVNTPSFWFTVYEKKIKYILDIQLVAI